MGLLHALTLARKENRREWEQAGELNRKIIQKGVDFGGAISGEHGIGLAHKEMYQRESRDNLALVRKLKSVFDPYGILNPVKIFDAA
jgi:FAD/FMN-containing dehydrogenase